MTVQKIVLMFQPSIIIRNGYPVEVHTVQTEDGYILNLHRIPYGKNKTLDAKRRPPVLIVHGWGENSASWVMIGNDSLGNYDI